MIKKKLGETLSQKGAKMWENHGFWIDKEREIVQQDYSKLPLLGKFGYNMMIFGLRMTGKLKDFDCMKTEK